MKFTQHAHTPTANANEFYQIIENSMRKIKRNDCTPHTQTHKIKYKIKSLAHFIRLHVCILSINLSGISSVFNQIKTNTLHPIGFG